MERTVLKDEYFINKKQFYLILSALFIMPKCQLKYKVVWVIISTHYQSLVMTSKIYAKYFEKLVLKLLIFTISAQLRFNNE